MKHSLRSYLALPLALVAGILDLACGSAPPVTEMAADGGDQVVGPALRELEAGSPSDSVGLSLVGAVADDPAGFLLTDMLNDRVVVVDTTFHLLAEFGSPGQGPGELDGPLKIVRFGGEVVIGEMANNRFSFYDRSGRFRRVVSSDHAASSFAVRADSTLLAAGPTEAFYARLIERSGREQAYLDRPSAIARVADSEPIGLLDSHVLVGPGDTTHVFDDQFGVLLKYDPDGRLLLARSLPDEVLQRAREQRRAMTEEFARQGRRVAGVPFLRTMRFADDGTLLLVVIDNDLVGLRVDPADYTYRRIVGDLQSGGLAYVSTAIDVSVRDDRLFAFSQYGLSVHRLMDRP